MTYETIMLPLGFLSQEQVTALASVGASIQHALEYGQLWRDPVEATCILSPLYKGATPQAVFWQATREQAVFARELIRLGFDYRRKLATQELIRLEIEELTSQGNHSRTVAAKLAIKQTDLEQCEFELSEMRLAAKDRVREIIMWAEIKTQHEKATPDVTCWWAGKEETMASHAIANLLSGRDPKGGVRDLVALGQTIDLTTETSPSLRVAKLAATWWATMQSSQMKEVSQYLEQFSVSMLTSIAEEE